MMTEQEEVMARWFTGIWTGKYEPLTDALACCGRHWRYWIQVEGVGDCPDCQAGLPDAPNAIPEKYRGPILPLSEDIDYDAHYENIKPPGWVPSEVYCGVAWKNLMRQYIRYNKWHRRLWRWVTGLWRRGR